jgi:hypothetical protein
MFLGLLYKDNHIFIDGNFKVLSTQVSMLGKGTVKMHSQKLLTETFMFG